MRVIWDAILNFFRTQLAAVAVFLLGRFWAWASNAIVSLYNRIFKKG